MRATVAMMLLVATLAPTPSVAQRSGGLFRDPEDRRVDVSEWLLERKGVLPVPIIITEPASGTVVGWLSRSAASRSASV